MVSLSWLNDHADPSKRLITMNANHHNIINAWRFYHHHVWQFTAHLCWHCRPRFGGWTSMFSWSMRRSEVVGSVPTFVWSLLFDSSILFLSISSIPWFFNVFHCPCPSIPSLGCSCLVVELKFCQHQSPCSAPMISTDRIIAWAWDPTLGHGQPSWNHPGTYVGIVESDHRILFGNHVFSS